VFNDAPTAQQRVSMSQLRLKSGSGGPTVRLYRLLVQSIPSEQPAANRPKHHAPITASSKAAFTALGKSKQVYAQRAQHLRYRCVQERRMAAVDALAHIGGEGKPELDARQVRLLDLELKADPLPGQRPVAMMPFGPPIPPTEPPQAAQAAPREGGEALVADAYVYDVYMADDAEGAQPSSQPAVYIEYDDDDGDEFASDEAQSDCSTDDSNAEGHYANDYPGSEHSSDGSARDPRFGADDDALASESDNSAADSRRADVTDVAGWGGSVAIRRGQQGSGSRGLRPIAGDGSDGDTEGEVDA
jgi:hypothetical protein